MCIRDSLQLTRQPFQAAGNFRNFLLTVIRVAAAAGDQLNVVDQDDGQTVLGLKLAAFGMNLGNPHVRGIVDEDLDVYKRQALICPPLLK